MLAQGKFSIEIKQAEKVMEMMVGGTFTPDDYTNFIHDYAQKTSSIDAKAYTLKVDCRTMNLLAPGEVEKLQGSFNRYNETGFQKIVFVITEQQSIIKMQLNRVARSAGLANAEIVTA